MKRYILLYAVMLCTANFSFAITNGDFESGDLSGWTVTLNAASVYSIPHVVTRTSGAAPYTLGGLNMVHGGSYAAELYSGYGDINHGDWAMIEQTVVVPPGYTDLEMYFAAVVSGTHYNDGDTAGSDAYTKFDILQGSTVVYSRTFSYFDNVSQLVDGTFDGTFGPFKYLPWQKVTVPLSSYIGQTLTIRYAVYDCMYDGHFCYGYIDDLRFVEPPTPTPTYTATPTITETYTYTPTFTYTPTYTSTPTATPTYTDTQTATPTYTVTLTVTATFTPTYTNTPVPFVFNIKGPFPNPSDETHIVFYLSRDADVRVQVFTVSGEKVRRGSMQGIAGYNQWFWDATNDSGKPASSGIFIVRMEALDPIYGKKYTAWCKAAIVK